MSEEKINGCVIVDVSENRNILPIKAFKITDNGEITHMCYACKRIDTGELGMYDVIENKFIPINKMEENKMKIDNRPTYKIPLYDIHSLTRTGNDETEVNFTLSEKNKYCIQKWEVPDRGNHWTKEDFETSIKICINNYIDYAKNAEIYAHNHIEDESIDIVDYLGDRFEKMRNEGLNFNLSPQKTRLRKAFEKYSALCDDGNCLDEERWKKFNSLIFTNTKGADEIYESSKVIVEKYYTIRLSTIQYLWFKIRHPRIDIFREGK